MHLIIHIENSKFVCKICIAISNRSASRPGSWRRQKLRIKTPLVRCIFRNITRLKIGICEAWCLDARQWFSAISHHLALGGIRVPSCSQIDWNPLTAGYCRQGVQVYSKSLILAVTFYFQSIFFLDSVHFCQLTTRSHLVLELRWI
jgi:hypothetical protein